MKWDEYLEQAKEVYEEQEKEVLIVFWIKNKLLLYTTFWITFRYNDRDTTKQVTHKNKHNQTRKKGFMMLPVLHSFTTRLETKDFMSVTSRDGLKAKQSKQPLAATNFTGKYSL